MILIVVNLVITPIIIIKIFHLKSLYLSLLLNNLLYRNKLRLDDNGGIKVKIITLIFNLAYKLTEALLNYKKENSRNF